MAIGETEIAKLIEVAAATKNEENSEQNIESSVVKLAKSVVMVDVGNLLAVDPRPIDANEFKKNPDNYIKELATVSTQLIVNSLFTLPTERVQDVMCAKLPKGVITFPREKPLPKEKPLTKWESYAKMKGIKKTKKTRKVYDETSKEWRPTWGYKKTLDKDTTNNWLIEYKGKDKDDTDHFAKRTEAKSERVAKNELQRLRNISRATGGKKKVPGVGLTPNVADDGYSPSQLKLKKSLSMAKTADASMSKFSQKLKTEDTVTRGFGKKRKFESNTANNENEQAKQIKLLDKLTTTNGRSNKKKLNVDKAANKFISNEDNENSGSAKGKRRSDSGKHRKTSVRDKKSRPGAGPASKQSKTKKQLKRK